jgi:hypothetical protein
MHLALLCWTVETVERWESNVLSYIKQAQDAPGPAFGTWDCTAERFSLTTVSLSDTFYL